MRCAAALAFVIAAALLGSRVQAARQWYDGPWVYSPMQHCVTGLPGHGAGIRIGFEASPRRALQVGDTFYAHAIFGMVSGCVDPQRATLEIVMPAGAALAVDANHPVRCEVSTDGGKIFSQLTPCVNAPAHGTYGQKLLPAGKPAWAMPSGHIFIVEFPMRATQPMHGLTAGTCPRDLDELRTLPHGDCLIAAFHLADGYRNPWLVAHQSLLVVR